jgi:hypothetical protein
MIRFCNIKNRMLMYKITKKSLFSSILFVAGIFLGATAPASASPIFHGLTIVSEYTPGSDYTYEWLSDSNIIGVSPTLHLGSVNGAITFSLVGSELTLNFQGPFDAIPNASTQFGHTYGPTSYLYIGRSNEAIVGASLDSESIQSGFLASNLTVGAPPAYANGWEGNGIYINLANGLPTDKLVISISMVPEPETYQLFLAGFLLIWFAGRRRINW